MRKILSVLAVLAIATALSLSLTSCDLLGALGDLGGTGGAGGLGGLYDDSIESIDNSKDLIEFVPGLEEDNYAPDEDYYLSKAIDLVTEIRGNYSIERPFMLDESDDTKRIYKNIYFYEEDYFQLLYFKNGSPISHVYAMLSDENDSEYAEVEYTDGGNPLQVNIIKSGIYDLILDVTTLEIDMVRVGNIDTPVYETIKSCELYIHNSLNDYTYTEMAFNKETNEYYLETQIPRGASLGFFSASHNSRYKVIVDSSIVNKTIYYHDISPDLMYANVGGTYKVYINAKTYQVRFELQNPDTASYFCQVGFGEDVVLSPVSQDTPYLFRYEFLPEVENKHAIIPSFYPELGFSYVLEIIDEEGLVEGGDSLFGNGTTYILEINLKDFTLTVTEKN